MIIHPPGGTTVLPARVSARPTPDLRLDEAIALRRCLLYRRAFRGSAVGCPGPLLRFDAVAKTYRYTIFRDEVCPPFDWRYVYHHPYPLDEEAMFRAASVYAGEHDFKAFAAADHRSEPASTVRTIFSSVMERRGSTMIYTVRGSGFLKHMVRNIVGTILEAGRGNISAETLPKQSGRTAPAKGLTLVSVEYPEGSAWPLRY